jgi:uncharacterized protein
MKKKILIFLLAFVILLLSVVFFSNSISGKKVQPTFLNPYLTINNTRINLSIADTPTKEIQGLSGQKSLEKDAGMLFVFKEKQVRNFWMKNMNFPLDIVWIDSDKIVKISADLPAESEHPKNLYSSDIPVDRVLELNAGFCENNKIKVSDSLQYFLQK